VKDEIDHRFPAGTLRSDFTQFCKNYVGWHTCSTASGDDYISIGQEPSPVWYCGPWEVGVVTQFTRDRITSTEVTSWGLNCP
jgi:hypothetical protein